MLPSIATSSKPSRSGAASRSDNRRGPPPLFSQSLRDQQARRAATAAEAGQALSGGRLDDTFAVADAVRMMEAFPSTPRPSASRAANGASSVGLLPATSAKGPSALTPRPSQRVSYAQHQRMVRELTATMVARFHARLAAQSAIARGELPVDALGPGHEHGLAPHHHHHPRSATASSQPSLLPRPGDSRGAGGAASADPVASNHHHAWRASNRGDATKSGEAAREDQFSVTLAAQAEEDVAALGNFRLSREGGQRAPGHLHAATGAAGATRAASSRSSVGGGGPSPAHHQQQQQLQQQGKRSVSSDEVQQGLAGSSMSMPSAPSAASDAAATTTRLPPILKHPAATPSSVSRSIGGASSADHSERVDHEQTKRTASPRHATVVGQPQHAATPSSSTATAAVASDAPRSALSRSGHRRAASRGRVTIADTVVVTSNDGSGTPQPAQLTARPAVAIAAGLSEVPTAPHGSPATIEAASLAVHGGTGAEVPQDKLPGPGHVATPAGGATDTPAGGATDTPAGTRETISRPSDVDGATKVPATIAADDVYASGAAVAAESESSKTANELIVHQAGKADEEVVSSAAVQTTASPTAGPAPTTQSAQPNAELSAGVTVSGGGGVAPAAGATHVDGHDAAREQPSDFFSDDDEFLGESPAPAAAKQQRQQQQRQGTRSSQPSAASAAGNKTPPPVAESLSEHHLQEQTLKATTVAGRDAVGSRPQPPSRGGGPSTPDDASVARVTDEAAPPPTLHLPINARRGDDDEQEQKEHEPPTGTEDHHQVPATVSASAHAKERIARMKEQLEMLKKVHDHTSKSTQRFSVEEQHVAALRRQKEMLEGILSRARDKLHEDVTKTTARQKKDDGSAAVAATPRGHHHHHHALPTPRHGAGHRSGGVNSTNATSTAHTPRAAALPTSLKLPQDAGSATAPGPAATGDDGGGKADMNTLSEQLPNMRVDVLSQIEAVLNRRRLAEAEKSEVKGSGSAAAGKGKTAGGKAGGATTTSLPGQSSSSTSRTPAGGRGAKPAGDGGPSGTGSDAGQGTPADDGAAALEIIGVSAMEVPQLRLTVDDDDRASAGRKSVTPTADELSASFSRSQRRPKIYDAVFSPSTSEGKRSDADADRAGGDGSDSDDGGEAGKSVSLPPMMPPSKKSAAGQSMFRKWDSMRVFSKPSETAAGAEETPPQAATPEAAPVQAKAPNPPVYVPEEKKTLRAVDKLRAHISHAHERTRAAEATVAAAAKELVDAGVATKLDAFEEARADDVKVEFKKEVSKKNKYSEKLVVLQNEFNELSDEVTVLRTGDGDTDTRDAIVKRWAESGLGSDSGSDDDGGDWSANDDDPDAVAMGVDLSKGGGEGGTTPRANKGRSGAPAPGMDFLKQLEDAAIMRDYLDLRTASVGVQAEVKPPKTDLGNDGVSMDPRDPDSMPNQVIASLYRNEQALYRTLDNLTIAVANVAAFFHALDVDLTCRSCLQTMSQPRSLMGCGHCFCAECVNQMYIGIEAVQCAECQHVSHIGCMPNPTVTAIISQWNARGAGREDAINGELQQLREAIDRAEMEVMSAYGAVHTVVSSNERVQASLPGASKASARRKSAAARLLQAGGGDAFNMGSIRDVIIHARVIADDQFVDSL